MLMDAAAQLGQDVAAAMAAAQRLFEGDVHGAVDESGSDTLPGPPKPPPLPCALQPGCLPCDSG